MYGARRRGPDSAGQAASAAHNQGCYSVTKMIVVVLIDAETFPMHTRALLLFLLIAVAQTAGARDTSIPLKVFASVLPVQTFVESVGGERVDTEVMVLPGHSPATYDPSPKQVAALAEADLYVRVGVPFEDAWMKRIQATNPDLPILDLRDGLQLRAQEEHEHAHEPRT